MVRAVVVVAATPAPGPQLVFFGLPVAEAPPGHGFQEGADAVGRDPDQPGPEDREQVGGVLRREPGVGDLLLVGKDVGDPVNSRVELLVLGTAVGVDPEEVGRRVGFDQAPEPVDFLGVGVEVQVRPGSADPQPRVQVVVGFSERRVVRDVADLLRSVANVSATHGCLGRCRRAEATQVLRRLVGRSAESWLHSQERQPDARRFKNSVAGAHREDVHEG